MIGDLLKWHFFRPLLWRVQKYFQGTMEFLLLAIQKCFGTFSTFPILLSHSTPFQCQNLPTRQTEQLQTKIWFFSGIKSIIKHFQKISSYVTTQNICTVNAKGQCGILKVIALRSIFVSYEWGWTAQNSIARQSFARHFWQEINCSTQNLSTAQIRLSEDKLDSSSWHFFLVQHINWKSPYFTYRNGQ